MPRNSGSTGGTTNGTSAHAAGNNAAATPSQSGATATTEAPSSTQGAQQSASSGRGAWGKSRLSDQQVMERMSDDHEPETDVSGSAETATDGAGGPSEDEVLASLTKGITAPSEDDDGTYEKPEDGETQATGDTETDDDAPDFGEIDLSERARQAGVLLRRAGMNEARLQKLWKTDKEALIDLAEARGLMGGEREGQKNEGSGEGKGQEQAAGTFEQALDKAIAQPLAALGSTFDEGTAGAIASVTKAAAKAIESHVGQMLKQQFGPVLAKLADAEYVMEQMGITSAAAGLVAKYPDLADPKNFAPGSELHEEMQTLAKTGRFQDMGKLMERAAKAVYGEKTAAQQQKANFEEHRKRSLGTPGATKHAASPGGTGVIEMTLEQWQRKSFDLQGKWPSDKIQAFRNKHVRIVKPKAQQQQRRAG